jgi:glycosyltransferase involved in cell wall biosynthesis
MALALPLPKIVVASYLKEIVASQGAGQVIAVVHNGVDSTDYFPSVPESERNGVGTIYSSHPAKDPGTVISVIERLKFLRPQVPLRVFGGDRRPPQLDSSSYWRYPSVEQAREIYSRSLVWIVGSWSEGFPAPVLEAMACGCAVVATDCGGPKDIIVDGVNGFLVPVRDTQAIIKRAEQILDDPMRCRICTGAQETISRFTWEKCVCELEAALATTLRRQERAAV